MAGSGINLSLRLSEVPRSTRTIVPAAAATMGMRFHATRGSMSVGRSEGGLPPDSLVEREDAILDDTRRVPLADFESYLHGAAAAEVLASDVFEHVGRLITNSR